MTFVPSLVNCSHEVSSECVNTGCGSGTTDAVFVLTPDGVGVLTASVCATSSCRNINNAQISERTAMLPP